MKKTVKGLRDRIAKVFKLSDKPRIKKHKINKINKIASNMQESVMKQLRKEENACYDAIKGLKTIKDPNWREGLMNKEEWISHYKDKLRGSKNRQIKLARKYKDFR